MPEATRQEFEKLKEDFPEVFSLNNQDIGHTQLVTMHVNTGDSPPHLSKTLYFTFKALQLGTTRDRDSRASRHHQKEPQSMGQSNCCCPQEIRTWRTRQVENVCVDFRKINDLQPQVRRVDSATQWKHFTGPTTQN